MPDFSYEKPSNRTVKALKEYGHTVCAGY